MNQMYVKVIKDSITHDDERLITIHAHYPRIIHSEIMSHRVFSRNARSSRAVPVKTMIQEVRDDPFIPWHWGKNQPGMQAAEEWNAPIVYHDNEGHPFSFTKEEVWKHVAFQAASSAEAFMNAGYHKQVANRLLEPFMYIDTLISSTSWENFFHLRDHEDAEPHFHDLAKMIRNAIDESQPEVLHPLEWHLPYVTDREKENFETETLIKLSVARCARVSYAPFDGDSSINKELERYKKLVSSEPLHASPAEHQAQVFHGASWKNDLHGNFSPRWVQFRKTLPNEFVKD